MTTALVIRSLLELTGILLLLWGIAKEEKLIAFEQKVWRVLFVNYRRYKRKKLGLPKATSHKVSKAQLHLCENHPSKSKSAVTHTPNFVA